MVTEFEHLLAVWLVNLTVLAPPKEGWLSLEGHGSRLLDGGGGSNGN
jgi:hypothetical protein